MHVPKPQNVLLAICVHLFCAIMASSSSAMPRYMSSTIASHEKQKPALHPSSELDIERPRAARLGPPPSPLAPYFSPFQTNIASSALAESEIDVAAADDDQAELQVQQEMGCALDSSPPP